MFAPPITAHRKLARKPQLAAVSLRDCDGLLIDNLLLFSFSSRIPTFLGIDSPRIRHHVYEAVVRRSQHCFRKLVEPWFSLEV